MPGEGFPPPRNFDPAVSPHLEAAAANIQQAALQLLNDSITARPVSPDDVAVLRQIIQAEISGPKGGAVLSRLVTDGHLSSDEANFFRDVFRASAALSNLPSSDRQRRLYNRIAQYAPGGPGTELPPPSTPSLKPRTAGTEPQGQVPPGPLKPGQPNERLQPLYNEALARMAEEQFGPEGETPAPEPESRTPARRSTPKWERELEARQWPPAFPSTSTRRGVPLPHWDRVREEAKERAGGDKDKYRMLMAEARNAYKREAYLTQWEQEGKAPVPLIRHPEYWRNQLRDLGYTEPEVMRMYPVGASGPPNAARLINLDRETEQGRIRNQWTDELTRRNAAAELSKSARKVAKAAETQQALPSGPPLTTEQRFAGNWWEHPERFTDTPGAITPTQRQSVLANLESHRAQVLAHNAALEQWGRDIVRGIPGTPFTPQGLPWSIPETIPDNPALVQPVIRQLMGKYGVPMPEGANPNADIRPEWLAGQLRRQQRRLELPKAEAELHPVEQSQSVPHFRAFAYDPATNQVSYQSPRGIQYTFIPQAQGGGSYIPAQGPRSAITPEHTRELLEQWGYPDRLPDELAQVVGQPQVRWSTFLAHTELGDPTHSQYHLPLPESIEARISALQAAGDERRFRFTFPDGVYLVDRTGAQVGVPGSGRPYMFGNPMFNQTGMTHAGRLRDLEAFFKEQEQRTGITFEDRYGWTPKEVSQGLAPASLPSPLSQEEIAARWPKGIPPSGTFKPGEGVPSPAAITSGATQPPIVSGIIPSPKAQAAAQGAEGPVMPLRRNPITGAVENVPAATSDYLGGFEQLALPRAAQQNLAGQYGYGPGQLPITPQVRYAGTPTNLFGAAFEPPVYGPPIPGGGPSGGGARAAIPETPLGFVPLGGTPGGTGNGPPRPPGSGPGPAEPTPTPEGEGGYNLFKGRATTPTGEPTPTTGGLGGKFKFLEGGLGRNANLAMLAAPFVTPYVTQAVFGPEPTGWQKDVAETANKASTLIPAATFAGSLVGHPEVGAAAGVGLTALSSLSDILGWSGKKGNISDADAKTKLSTLASGFGLDGSEYTKYFDFLKTISPDTKAQDILQSIGPQMYSAAQQKKITDENNRQLGIQRAADAQAIMGIQSQLQAFAAPYNTNLIRSGVDEANALRGLAKTVAPEFRSVFESQAAQAEGQANRLVDAYQLQMMATPSQELLAQSAQRQQSTAQLQNQIASSLYNAQRLANQGSGNSLSDLFSGQSTSVTGTVPGGQSQLLTGQGSIGSTNSPLASYYG